MKKGRKPREFCSVGHDLKLVVNQYPIYHADSVEIRCRVCEILNKKTAIKLMPGQVIVRLGKTTLSRLEQEARDTFLTIQDFCSQCIEAEIAKRFIDRKDTRNENFSNRQAVVPGTRAGTIH